MYKLDLPLGLPKGSVRSILALGIVFGTMAIYVVKGQVADWMISAFGTAVGFYFGTRARE